MEEKTWKPYVWAIFLTEAVGALSGWLSKNGMHVYAKTIAQPPLSPPSWLFPIVWGILYALMGISAARVYLSPPSPERSSGLNLYVLQLIVNFFWSLIFFNAQAFLLAFFWLMFLWLLVLGMLFVFSKTDSLAGKLQIPYLLWLSFAAYLNLGVWYLNR